MTTTDARTFTATIDDLDGIPRARLIDTRDARPDDADGMAAALSKLCPLSTPQVEAIAHALAYAIRHAGYYRSKPEECVVDFDSIALYDYGGGRSVYLIFSGLASAAHRGPGRFMVTYNHGLIIGRRGGYRCTVRGGRTVTGPAAVRELDYFGREA
jgi:hypothetical protein